MGETRSLGKSFDIPKMLIWEAYLKVSGNKGAAGVDGQSLAEFEQDLRNNLFKLWNRMSSGSYFPGPVKAVPIPKPDGGTRILGVPTIADRIAQTAVAMILEPEVEPVFHTDSYDYRPGKSALDAVEVCKQRCWRRPWVVDLDIQRLLRQRSACANHRRSGETHGLAMGCALCESVACRAGSAPGWQSCRPRQGNSAGFGDFTIVVKPLPALRVGLLARQEFPSGAVREVLRRRCPALFQRAASEVHPSCRRGTVAGVRVALPSGQDSCRLLQTGRTQRGVPGYEFHVSGLRFSSCTRSSA